MQIDTFGELAAAASIISLLIGIGFWLAHLHFRQNQCDEDVDTIQRVLRLGKYSNLPDPPDKSPYDIESDEFRRRRDEQRRVVRYPKDAG